jgi:hypothetical protein
MTKKPRIHIVNKRPPVVKAFPNDDLSLTQVTAFLEFSKMDMPVTLPLPKWLQVLTAAKLYIEEHGPLASVQP